MRLQNATIHPNVVSARRGLVCRAWLGAVSVSARSLAGLPGGRSWPEAVRPLLELQARWSRIPAPDELLIERIKTREGHHLFFYPFESCLVHEGRAALLAYRLSCVQPITLTLSANDYGFELLSPDPAPLFDKRRMTKA